MSSKKEEETTAQKQGTISLPRQRDSYLFQASPGTQVNVTVNGIGTTPLADPIVELYDPEDFLIAANDNYAGRGRNSVITSNLLTAGRSFPDPSTYRIVVTGLDKTSGVTTQVSNSLFHVRQENGGKYELKVFTGPLAGGGPVPPAVAAVTPNIAVQGAADIVISVNGTNFANGASAEISGTGVTIKTVTFVSSSQLSLIADVASDAAAGLRDITVTNPDGLSGKGIFEVRKTLGNVLLKWSAPLSGNSLDPPGNLSAALNPGASAAPLAGVIHTAGKIFTGRKSPRDTKVFRSSQFHHISAAQGIIKEEEPNNSPLQAQALAGDTLIELSGQAELRDAGVIVTEDDDIEDLFKITTRSAGLNVLLSGFTSDCDLYLLDESGANILGSSLNPGENVDEFIESGDLSAGSYLIGVSIYDPDPLGPDSTKYLLQAEGDFGELPALRLQSYNVYRSIKSNARTTGTKIGSIAAGTTSFPDPVPYTGDFYYQVTAVYNQGESAPSNEVSKTVTEVKKDGNVIPSTYALRQNYPNPFNPTTMIRFELPVSGNVRLAVYDLLGREVMILVNELKEAGSFTVQFDASGLASGIYFYRLSAGRYINVKKMILLR